MSSPTAVKSSMSPGGSPSRSPSNKRKVGPSAKRSSLRRASVAGTANNGSLASQGNVFLKSFSNPDQLSPHTHLLSRRQEDEKATWNDHDIRLPFNLRDRSIDIYKDEVHDLLYRVFPGTENVAETRWRSHLIFQVIELPELPWPLTIGGVPFTINDYNNQGRTLIFPTQTLGNLEISICQQGYNVEEFSDKELRKLGADVYSWFEENLPEAGVIELMLTCERTIYIILEDYADISSLGIALPGKIAQCPVGYINDYELHRPSMADLPAKREIDPQPITETVDNTEYDILRPGVLICCEKLKGIGYPKTFSTSSGVLVQDGSGRPFMTAASHGIGEDKRIWQADHPRRRIGQAKQDIAFIDVTLVELSNGITFVNEPFENGRGESPRLSRLATSEDRFLFDYCYLNSPVTGYLTASVVSKSVKLMMSVYPDEDRLRYVIYNWCYLGQAEGNRARLRPAYGACGSAIWDDNGVVTGFYYYYIRGGPWMGFGASVSASELVEAGYTLVRT